MANLANLALFISLLPLKIAAAPNTINLAFQDSENFPFQLGDGTEMAQDKPGIAVELLLMVEEKLGLKFKFKRLPWKRGEAELKDGIIDGLFGASFKAERQEFGVYPMKNGNVDSGRRFYYNSYALYRNINREPKVGWDGKTFSGLNEQTQVSAIRGFSIVEDLKKMGLKMHESRSVLDGFKMLNADRVGAVAALERAGDSILAANKAELNKVEKVMPLINTKDYFLLLSHRFVKASPKLAEDIWDAISALSNSPEFKSRERKYFE